MARERRASGVEAEFERAELGDARLSRRLVSLAACVAAAPDKSFPKLASTDAELEAIYRFWNNDRVTPAKILQPHQQATVKRCAEAGLVWAVHDTTEFHFSGEREGLGVLLDHQRGFLGHVCLAVEAGEERIPLGVLAVEPIFRDVPPKSKRRPLNERKLLSRKTPRAEKESRRWEDGAESAQQLLSPVCQVVHVMDQEADDYVLLARLAQRGQRFIIRASGERLLKPRGESLRSTVEREPSALFREVPLSARTKKKGSHPARGARIAKLHVRATALTLKRPQHAQTDADSVNLNLVQVFEPEPPADAEPVEWMLLTTEPISTGHDLEQIVDGYRARWRIEEYFKALKTGCAFEKRQLESKEALLNALALLAPIAWKLLLLKELGRSETERPATELFAQVEISLVRALSTRVKLTAAPTIREMMLAIAGMGGHLKRNGDPGWQTLGAGFQRLTEALVIRAALVAEM